MAAYVALPLTAPPGPRNGAAVLPGADADRPPESISPPYEDAGTPGSVLAPSGCGLVLNMAPTAGLGHVGVLYYTPDASEVSCTNTGVFSALSLVGRVYPPCLFAGRVSCVITITAYAATASAR